MDASRKANREADEITLQYQTQQETVRIEQLEEEKLTQLQVSLAEIGRTPAGAAEQQRRSKLFGECNRLDGETSGQFYTRLRHWLDRDLPQTKSPLHAPRQTGE